MDIVEPGLRPGCLRGHVRRRHRRVAVETRGDDVVVGDEQIRGDEPTGPERKAWLAAEHPRLAVEDLRDADASHRTRRPLSVVEKPGRHQVADLAHDLLGQGIQLHLGGRQVECLADRFELLLEMRALRGPQGVSQHDLGCPAPVGDLSPEFQRLNQFDHRGVAVA